MNDNSKDILYKNEFLFKSALKYFAKFYNPV